MPAFSVVGLFKSLYESGMNLGRYHMFPKYFGSQLEQIMK